MKCFCSALLFTILSAVASANLRTYVGSTPAHQVVRSFLQISSTDSIDFIRWKLEIDSAQFSVRCEYGLAQPSTAGFRNTQYVTFKGQFTRSAHHYQLMHHGHNISMLEVDANLMHFLDASNQMLIGNGGYSYALNITAPVMANEVNLHAEQKPLQSPLVFEGRTPCQDLATHLGLQKSEACNKMKWYFILYADSVTNKPAHFLMGGLGYRKESMARGSWQIIHTAQGQVVYRLSFDKWSRPLDLVKGDDNILFFVDAAGRLLVGNKDFSYTLNRRPQAYPPVAR